MIMTMAFGSRLVIRLSASSPLIPASLISSRTRSGRSFSMIASPSSALDRLQHSWPLRLRKWAADRANTASSSMISILAIATCSRGMRQRKKDLNCGPPLWSVRDDKAPAVRTDDLLRHRETKAHPVTLRRKIGGERLLKQIGRDSAAIVIEIDGDGPWPLTFLDQPRRDRDRFPWRGCVTRIRQERHQRLFQIPLIERRQRECRVKVHLDVNLFCLDYRTNDMKRICDDPVQITGNQSRCDRFEGEQKVMDPLLQMIDCVNDALKSHSNLF